MKIALITMMDDRFIKGFEAFIKSLLHHNPWFNYPMIIINTGLIKENQKKCKKMYDNIHFFAPKEREYRHVNMKRTEYCLRKTYYKLDMFSYENFDRLVFIDMDTIILGDISYLFTQVVAPIGACKAYDWKGDRLRNDYNSGVLVLNSPVINLGTYRKLIIKARQGYSMPDQKTINNFFGKRIYQIPKIYNCEKRVKDSIFLHYDNNKGKLRLQQDDIRILHFVSHKPWNPSGKSENNQGYEDLEEIWKKYYEM